MRKFEEQTGVKSDGEEGAPASAASASGDLQDVNINDLSEFIESREDLGHLLISLSQFNGFISALKPDELIPFEKIDSRIMDLLKRAKMIQEADTSLPAKVLGKWVQPVLKIVIALLNETKDQQQALDDWFNFIIKSLGQAKRPRRERVIRLMTSTRDRLMGALEASGKPLMQNSNDLRTYSTRFYTEMRKLIVELVEKSFITGELNSLALYSRPDLWINLGKRKEYIPTLKGLELLRKHLDEIVELVSKDRDNVKIFDLGIGTGNKAEVIIEKFVGRGKRVRYFGVDISERMLETATISLMTNLLDRIFEIIEKGGEIPEDMEPWRPFIEFISGNGLKLSDHQLLKDQLLRIYYKFTNPKFYKRYFSETANPQLFKHFAARMLSLHVRTPAEDVLIETIDKDIKFPVNFIPRCQLIETLNCGDYGAEGEEEVVAFDLGCRGCAMTPSESIKDYQKFLSRADVEPEFDAMDKDDDAEAKVRAPYLIVGMQVRHFDENNPAEYEKEKKSLLKGYETPEAEAFVLHPYTELNYRDASGAELNFYQLRDKKTADGKPYCDFITEYGSDPQNPSEKRVIHKLRFNQPITVIGNDEIHLIKGHEILLLSSYKPTLEQLIELYTGNQIHICKIYMDDEKNPTYVKLVLRKMTPVEIKIPTEKRIDFLKRKFFGQDSDNDEEAEEAPAEITKADTEKF